MQLRLTNIYASTIESNFMQIQKTFMQRLLTLLARGPSLYDCRRQILTDSVQKYSSGVKVKGTCPGLKS